jgi:negative regulator of flagellin synthesis FlgM
MMINPIDPYNKLNKIGKVGETGKGEGIQKSSKGSDKISDSINISDQAKGLLENKRAFEIARNEPDIRTDKVNQIKKTIQDGSFEQTYFNDKVLREVADKITDTFLGRG